MRPWICFHACIDKFWLRRVSGVSLVSIVQFDGRKVPAPLHCPDPSQPCTEPLHFLEHVNEQTMHPLMSMHLLLMRLQGCFLC